MRLLSLLTDVENALATQSAGDRAGRWQTTRIVNYRHGLARLTVSPVAPRAGARTGSILLQAFTLADGAGCVKSSLSWTGSDESPLFTVYATPELDWNNAAAQIASAWSAGPAQQPASTVDFSRQIAVAG